MIVFSWRCKVADCLSFSWVRVYCHVKLNGNVNQPVELGYRFLCHGIETLCIEGQWDYEWRPGSTGYAYAEFDDSKEWGIDAPISCEIFMLNPDGSATILGGIMKSTCI